MSAKREFRASLQCYVRESGEERDLVDQRRRLLESMMRLPPEQVLLMEQHDLAAMLTCACRPAGKSKVACESVEVRNFIDMIERQEGGEGFEAELCNLLAYALKEGALAHLVWNNKPGSIAQAVMQLTATDTEEVPAHMEEPGSLFDRREAVTEVQ